MYIYPAAFCSAFPPYIVFLAQYQMMCTTCSTLHSVYKAIVTTRNIDPT